MRHDRRMVVPAHVHEARHAAARHADTVGEFRCVGVEVGVLGWNLGEDRSRIRAGHGPANVTRLRRFADGILKAFSDGKTSIAEKNAPPEP